MADPLSILGAIAAASQLAQQASEIVKFFSDLYAKIQDASESIRTRMLHIEQLIDISKLIAKTPTLQTAAIQSVLVTCLQTAITLREVLQELSSDEEGRLRRIMNAVRAVRKDDKIMILLDNIERDKISLALCIHQIDA
jgi:N-terminal domain on NACHT_NTPase and P-loop NTPases